MIKVGDKVRILENAVVGSDNITVTKLHNFAIGSIVKVVRDCGKDGLWFYGAYKNVKTVKAIRKTIANGKIYVNKTAVVK